MLHRSTLLFASALALAGCVVDPDDPSLDEPGDEDGEGEDCGDGVSRPDGWTFATHCNEADPDYAALFDTDEVHRLDITISAENHALAMADLDELLGGGGGGPGGGGPGGGGPGGGDLDAEPLFVPVTVAMNGVTWWQVGMRYKGNSSLRSAYRQNIGKFAFRLDFDEFEDDHPELDDQRFHGFKKMTFSNGFMDPSLIRDKVAADLFRAAGVPAARGTFARIYVDAGDGPVYYGLYTMIEDPSDAMPDAWFDDGDGNLYKPDGEGARLLQFAESDVELKTNEDVANYSDIQTLIAAINAGGDAAAWRAQLEAVLDVDRYLTHLALNQAMVNWDTYGRMTHNYYLYSDPSDDRFTWIPWDLNEAILERNGGMAANAGAVFLEDVGTDWPLIRNILDDPEYLGVYVDKLREVLDGAFAEDAVNARVQTAHDRIAPYVVGADGEQPGYTFLRNEADFQNSVDVLRDHVADRHVVVEAALR